MMKLIIKKAHIFFLFLAAVIFNVHSFIPHDHHQVDSDICTTNRIPLTNNTNPHPVFPVHCHAFNDLVLEKAVVVNHLQTFHFIDIILTEVQDINLPVYQVSFNEDPEHPVHSSPSELFLLRAPPHLWC